MTSRTCLELSLRDICLCVVLNRDQAWSQASVVPTTSGDFFASYPVFPKSLSSVKVKKFGKEHKSCRSYEFRQISTLLRAIDYVNVRFIPSRGLTVQGHPTMVCRVLVLNALKSLIRLSRILLDLSKCIQSCAIKLVSFRSSKGNYRLFEITRASVLFSRKF